MNIIHPYFADDVKSVGIQTACSKLTFSYFPTSKFQCTGGRMIKISAFYIHLRLWKINIIGSFYYNNKKFNTETKERFK